ncbi:MAG: amino acid transporter [Elusimicrobia bacterium RIFOXYB2_FULL_49_7]|nr:MAG: amino acid transporter [Elusimicrobia bacterium RIFOXYB2_FULL_49_7]
MDIETNESIFGRARRLLLGNPRDPNDRSIFHRLSLIAFFAWVGLGADGLSSSCYGPEEAFLALGHHPMLGLFVALASALTIFLISASYSQIIELFPTGGGGYLVATKLLSPRAGVVSGCALLIDYVLTISVSIAAGADAIFSILPAGWYEHKLSFAILGLAALTLLNLRGVRESVVPLVPIFLTFVLTHFFVIIYSLVTYSSYAAGLPAVAVGEAHSAVTELGLGGAIFLIFRAFTMGAGTYTGIEAVSNGLPLLREPRIRTGKRTLLYMSLSLAFTASGLMVAYLLFKVSPQHGKTLNAVLFETISASWGDAGKLFVLVSLLSAAALLFVAAQAGFLDGPRVLASMALDRWMPSRFALLNDRLVAQNGILVMSGAALATLLLTRGSIRYLIVLYSINVFITFCMSQLGMVRHWWSIKSKQTPWKIRLLVNGLGLTVTSLILLSVIAIKFNDGGWITLIVTGLLILIAFLIKKHYASTTRQLRRLDALLEKVAPDILLPIAQPPFNSKAKTAVIFVNGFNGLGLHTLFSVLRFFGGEFKNFLFISIGIVDTGNFKGIDEVEHLHQSVKDGTERYARFMQGQGYFSEGLYYIGTDVITAADRAIPDILARYPNSVFFGGQLVFSKGTFWTQWLHNYTVFSLQRNFYHKGIPFVILPIRV